MHESVVGRFEDGDSLQWDFATAAHSVIAGATRSGKSTLAYSVLSHAATSRHIAVVGVDPSGILLAPHRRSVSDWRVHLGTDNPHFAVDTMRELVGVMDARIDELMNRGLDKIPGAAFGPAFPLLLVVLEEYAGTLDWLRSNDALHRERLLPQMVGAVGRLLREGAKVGIRVLTLLQRPEATVLHDRAQYARRIAFRLDNADSVRMLHEASELDTVRRLMDAAPGVGLWHEAGERLRFFRADRLDYTTYRRTVLEAHQARNDGT
jgi:DNA segregation ATPase FtsK/SpoIIIE-like protein